MREIIIEMINMVIGIIMIRFKFIYIIMRNIINIGILVICWKIEFNKMGLIFWNLFYSINVDDMDLLFFFLL